MQENKNDINNIKGGGVKLQARGKKKKKENSLVSSKCTDLAKPDLQHPMQPLIQ